MCGIVGCVGYRDSVPMVLDGLARLEYRGYDSAGMAVIDEGILKIHRVKGKIAELRATTAAEASSVIRERVWAARERQRVRLAPFGVRCNAEMPASVLRATC